MVKKTTAPAAAAEVVKSDTALRNQLRNQAERHIIEQHREEFDKFAEALYTQNGLSFRRRVSAEERAAKVEADKKAKAKAKLDALLSEYPDLIPGQTSIDDLQNTGGVEE